MRIVIDRQKIADARRAALSEARRPLRLKEFRAQRGRRPFLGRILYAFSLPIILVWLVLAGSLNILVPQLEPVVTEHAQGFLPDQASSVQALVKMGEAFGGGGSNNFVYVLLEGNRPLDTDAHAYYTDIVHRLSSDTKHVNSALDLWSNPNLAPAAESSDGKAAFIMLNLAGNMGTALAMESTAAARQIIASVPPPPGITTYLTGASAVVNDEMVSIKNSTFPLVLAATALVTLVLLVVYRSLAAAAVPLLSVGISLATARSVISFGAEHGMVPISLFAAALMAVVVLGAGTNYGIFLLGRYQEGRRAGLSREDAYFAALAGVQHIIVASALTIAGAMACLAVTRLAMFSTSGLPCTIAIIVTLAASLTLGPAVLAVVSRLGLAEPRVNGSQRRWRRIGTSVARWPVPILVASLAALAVMIIPLASYHPSYNEREAQGSNTPANRGFTAADRHLPPNVMSPNVLILEADHDMRNPTDLIALAKLTDAIADIDGINAVQGITRPLAVPLDQGTLTNQAGYIGNRLQQMIDVLKDRIDDLGQIDGALDTLDSTVDGMTAALNQTSSGAQDLATSTRNLSNTADSVLSQVNQFSSQLTPLRRLIKEIPNCQQIKPCQTANDGLGVFDDLPQLQSAVKDLAGSTDQLGNALPAAAAQLPALKTSIATVRSIVSPLRGTLTAMIPQADQITEFLNEVSKAYAAGSPGALFFLPSQALESPLFLSGMPFFFSKDGKTTRMIVTTQVEGFSRESMDITAEVIPTSLRAIKGTSLAGSTISLGGPGGTLLNIESFAHEDFIAILVAAFAFVFCVVLVLLRSLVAAIAVIGTVGISYLAAMGVSVFIWQGLVGSPLHWSVAPLAFTFLVAVGADYNLLMVSRLREEWHAGVGTGLIRTMVGTGRVVTIAGLTFGITMLSMLAAQALNVAQVGTTVCVGLIIDTLLVRSLLTPSLARILGRWFWWPRPFVRLDRKRPGVVHRRGSGSNRR